MGKMSSVDGLFCCSEGSGLPLVTYHPGPGWNHEIFHTWLDPLAGEVELVHHHCRGNGRSARPKQWTHLGPAQTVADVDTVHRTVGLEELVLLGHSIGAYLAVEYARTHPHRVLGLILCAGAPAMDFAADDGVDGRELWRSDGTAAGTALCDGVLFGIRKLRSTKRYQHAHPPALCGAGWQKDPGDPSPLRTPGSQGGGPAMEALAAITPRAANPGHSRPSLLQGGPRTAGLGRGSFDR